MNYKEDTYLADTHLIKNNPENTGLLPSNKKYVNNKQPINPLATVLNNTFTYKDMAKLLRDRKKGVVNLEYIKENQKGIIEAYTQFYGEKGTQYLQEEMKEAGGFDLSKGLGGHEGKTPRGIPITLEQWEQYITNGGYEDHCFSCEARPDIIVFDFDYKLTEEQFQKIEKAFKKYLWVIERNLDKTPTKDGKCKYGNSHIYIQSTDTTAITKVKVGIKENKEDEEPLDIDIFKGGLKHVAATTPSRKYKIIYDGKPTSSINPRNAITLLSKTLGCHIDKKTLEEILQPQTHNQPTTTTTTTPEGEITVTSNNATDNQRAITIIENAIPIFTKLAGKKIREELYLSLPGALLRHGFNNARTLQIMTQIYNNTPDTDPRLETVKNTIEAYQEGTNTYGWTHFKDTVTKNTKNKHLKGNLNRIANTIFINQPPVIQQLNPQTKTVETAVLLADNGEQNFTEYEETTENPENIYEIKNNYSDFQIILDYENKTIAKRILKKDKKGNVKQEDTLIITAVPTHLEVYNDTICNAGKQYKCTWEYEDGTTTEVTGDIILHYKTLVKGGGVWNKNQLQNIISAVFGDLTKTKAHGTIIKNTPLQKGFYYDKETEEIIVVNHEIHKPTPEQLREALEVLDLYGSYFGYPKCTNEYTTKAKDEALIDTLFTPDPSRLAVFIRWCLNAPFHFVRKQMGMTNDQYIFLLGESGVGKTYGYFMAGLFMLGVENPKGLMVSGGSNSKAQISKNLAKTTFPILIDEGDRIVGKDDITSMLKHSVQGVYSRDVTDTETNQLTKELALAQLGFSANNVFEDTEKGALTNRILEIPFYSRDVPTPDQKQRFEKEFNTHYTPEDKRQVFKWIGYEYQTRILENPQIYKNEDPDTIAKQFFEEICEYVGYNDILDWINNDISKTTAEDERLQRRENLCDIIKTLLNKEMKHVVLKKPDSYYEPTLIDDLTTSPRSKIIHLAESNKVSWLRTNKNADCLIINSGIIRAIKKEDKNININNLEELKDILITTSYNIYDIGRYRVNENGKTTQKSNLLKIDIEVFSDLYEVY